MPDLTVNGINPLGDINTKLGQDLPDQAAADPLRFGRVGSVWGVVAHAHTHGGVDETLTTDGHHLGGHRTDLAVGDHAFSAFLKVSRSSSALATASPQLWPPSWASW